jgi:uncharacterized protein YdgA (DUF945 family)
MRKFLFILLAIIIVIILILPFLMGLLIEGEVKHQIGAMDFDNVQVKLLSYRNGWFSSNMRIEVKKKIPSAIQTLLDKKLPNGMIYQGDLRIAHGPIAMAYNLKHHRELYWGQGVLTGTFTLLSPKASTFSHYEGLNTPAKLFGVISLSGLTHITATHSGVKYNDQNKGLLLTIGNIVSHVTLNRNPNDIEGLSTINKLDISTKSIQTIFSPIKVHYHFSKTDEDNWMGKQFLTVKKIMVGKGGATFATIDGLQVNANNTVTKNLGNFFQDITVQHIGAMSFNFNQLQMVAVASNLNMAARKHLLSIIRDKSFKKLPKEEQKKILMGSLWKALEGSSYQLKTLQAKTPIGFVKATGYFSFPQTLESSNKTAPNFDNIIQSGKGELSVDLPNNTSSLLPAIMGPGPVLLKGESKNTTPAQSEIANVMIEKAYQSGYLVKKGDRFVGRVRLAHGNIYLNGKKLPLSFHNKEPKQPQVKPNMNIQIPMARPSEESSVNAE